MSTVAVSRRARGEEPEWTVLLTVAVALIIGFAIMTFTQDQTQTLTLGSTSVDYPKTWVQTDKSATSITATDLNAGGSYGERVTLQQVPKQKLLPRQGGLLEAADAWSLQRGMAWSDIACSALIKRQCRATPLSM